MPVLAVAGIAIEIIGIAILALILTYALDLFARAIAQVVPGFSIPGLGSLRNAIISGINGTIGVVKNIAVASLQPMINILRDPIVFFQALFNVIYSPITELVTTCSWIIHTAIPRATAAVVSYAQSLYNQSVATALSGLGQLRSYAEQLYNQAIAHANDLYNRAIAAATAADAVVHQYATDAANAVERDARALTAQAEALAQTLAAQTLAQALTAVTGSIQHADALAAQVEADAQSLAQGAINHADTAARAAGAAAIAAVTGPLITDLPGVWPGLVSGIDGIIDAAGDGFTDAIGAIHDLDLTVPISVGGALAVAIPAIGALAKLAEDCTIPNCRNLSGVGRELQSLFGLVENGLLFAFIAELARDPAGGVSLVENTLGGLANDAVTVGRAMVGI